MSRLRFVKPTGFLSALNRVGSVVAVAIVLVNLYRRLYLDTTDPYKCAALFHQGRWLDSPDRNPERQPFHNWQVPGCVLHEFKGPDIANCHEDGQILFVGDSTTRQVFWSTAKKLDDNRVFRKRADEMDTHTDVEFEVDGARLKFLWDPWLNSTALREELGNMIQHNAARNQGKDIEVDGKKRHSALIFIGGGLMHARHLKGEYLPRFKQAIDTITAIASATKPIRALEEPGAHGEDIIGDQLFFSPIVEPIYDRLSPSRELTIRPLKIQAMNEYLEKKSHRGLKVPWVFRNMTQDWPELMGENGIHVNERVASKMADVILNLRCNAKSAQNDEYPSSQTCCTLYRRPHWIQIILALLIVPLLLIKLRKRFSKSLDCNSYDNLVAAALTILFAVWYCYTLDRTQVFDKFPKEFANIDFRVMLGVAMLACLVNVKGVPSLADDQDTCLGRKTFERTSFLPREQSDEFKGWMQIYILVYGYTGASDILDFYEVFRVFVALYLFLSGYGHTMYFLQKRDYSLERLVSVLVRLNALPVLLAFAMRRPYTSYHFAPLVSFWFLVVYVTLGVGRQFNGSLWYLVGKVMASASLITVVIHSRGVLELLAEVPRILFRAAIDVPELRFHLGIDKYVVFIGVLVAAIHIHISTSLSTPHRQSHAVGRAIQEYFGLVQVFFIGLSLVTIPVFWSLTRRSYDKEDYNWWMPYIAWLPAVSFVILRNSKSFLRRYYCVSLAWLGQISLELYLLSSHIWLAGDGMSLPRIGFRHGSGDFLSDRWRDLVVLTPVFVWIAWRVHDATGAFTAWILDTPSSVETEASEGTHRSRNDETIELPHYSSNLTTADDQDFKGLKGKTGSLGLPGGSTKRLLIVVVIVWVMNLIYK